MPVKKEIIDDKDYSQSNVGSNPAINLAIGRMQYVLSDVGVGAGDLAINVSHIYNSKLNEIVATKIVGLGNKWKLNLTQFIITDNFDSNTGASILKYIDASGEIHRYVSFDTNKWYNDKKATSIIEKIDGNYVLTDGVGYKLYFNSQGYLFKSVSCQSAKSVKLYNYDANNRLVSVYDQRMLVNNVAKNRIEFVYNSNGNLEKMVSYTKNQPIVGCRYEYDTSNNLVAAFNLAYGAQQQVIAEKQIVKLCYDNGNMTMIINCETDGATLFQYDENGRVVKRSHGFVKGNTISIGMTDSAKNSISLSNTTELGLSCIEDYIEKLFNTFAYRYLADDGKIAVETDVTNECNITLRYFIDRNACVTSSFEVDKSFSRSGTSLKTLIKHEGQFSPSNENSELGYINGCATFLATNGQFSRSGFVPFKMVDGYPLQTEDNFNYSFWLKTKKNYDILKVKVVYKTIGSTATSEKTVFANPQAAGAWQQVIIPLALTRNTNSFNNYEINISFLCNNDVLCQDDFEITVIGMSATPCAELMVAANNNIYLPLSAVRQVRLIGGNGTQTFNIGANVYFTESDIISTYSNKHKKSGPFDVICNNGTKRIVNITGMQFYFPISGWSNYTGDKQFYIHTAMPVKDAHIKTHYLYDGSGFIVKNEYFKTIDGTNYQSNTSIRLDYLGKTIYEQDEYGTTKNYKYDSLGNLVELSVVNGSDVQSIQKYEYDEEGKIVSVNNGLTKQKISYNDVSQSQKIREYSYQDNTLTDTGHSLTSSIGIFRDKQVCVTEYDGRDKIGSVSLTYEKGLIRTISDGLVKYGVQHNLLKDNILYTQFDGNAEKPIQLDSVSEYWQNGGKYFKTHTSKFYDDTGKIVDEASVEIDAYGKPQKLAKGVADTYNYDRGNIREKYSYIYPEVQESEFTKKPRACKNLDDYSTTEYKYDNDGNLIGWKEIEQGKTAFEVKQIAQTTTKYIFGDNEQEYFTQINHDKDKMATPRIESVVVQEDKKSNIDRPTDIFRVDYKWTSLGNLSEAKTKNSTEKYSYLKLHDNLLLENTEYRSNVTYNMVTTTVKSSDSISYYENGLIKQETIRNDEFRAGLIPLQLPEYTSVRTYQYDNLHRITKEINTKLNVTRTYSYYPDGRLKKISGFNNDDVRNFSYDSKGRLASVNNITFAYDNFGNRISKTENGVTTHYAFDVGGRLVSAGGVNYSYNADGIRCKKTYIGSSKGERMYLDGGKILGEDRANYKLRYFYDATGLKRIRKIENEIVSDYECVKDSQGSIIMLVYTNGGIACRYEYDAFGKCTIVEQTSGMGDVNPFRWKGFFYDWETGFYYANGSYYDPDTGMYVDAAPVSAVFDNADSAMYIDRNGISCYNHFALASSSYTAFTTAEMAEDQSYDPGKTWWEKICNWWNNVPKWIKLGIGILVIVGLVIATIATGGVAGGLAGAVCAGALKGAAIGAVSEALVSGTIEGITSVINKQSFWDGFVNGAADGFVFGATIGAVVGGIQGANGWYNAKAVEFTHNPNSSEVVLGRSGVYEKTAISRGATYYQMPQSQWEIVSKQSSRAWKINKAFLKQQIRAGKTFLLASDPLTAGGYYFQKEIKFISRYVTYQLI